MQILIVTYSYAPHLTPRALRWSSIAEYWAKTGINVDVLCSYDPGLPDYELYNGVNVYRVGSKFMERARYVINKRPAFNMDIARQKAKTGYCKKEEKRVLQNNLRNFIKRIYKLTWPNIYWPDYACLWYFYARSKVKFLLDNNNYDVVISVSPPFTGHLVGQYVKNRFPEVVWLVDIGDPFCFERESPMNNRIIYNNLNYKKEKSVFRQANCISVTNEATKSIYYDLFGDVQGNINVIEPLYSARLDNNVSNTILDERKINLVYVGNFHKKTREPNTLLSLFNEIIKKYPEKADTLQMHFFGNTELLSSGLHKFKNLNDICRIHGPSPRNKVMAAINNCDFLVNVSNSTNYQLPSKLIEYVVAGKPIINIYSIDDDLTAAYLENYPLIINVDSRNCLKEVDRMAEFIESKRGYTADTSVTDAFVYNYSIPVISEKYMKLIMSR